MTKNLSVHAGKKALALIRDRGVSPDMVEVIAGAAGGPKWLPLYHLDRRIFSWWITRRTRPLYLIGSSVGAWRFAAAAQNNPAEALDNFTRAYIEQTYDKKPTIYDVTHQAMQIMEAYLDDKKVYEIFRHPYLRLNFLAVHCLGPAATDSRPVLGLCLAAAALLNILDRRLLRCFFKRSLFYNSTDPPPFFKMNQFPILHVPLNEKNLRGALLAAGSIPMVMRGVQDIPDAPPGVYRDGGVIDYHLDIDFTTRDDNIVLFPHYTNRIIPGWFDKKLKRRKPDAERMSSVLMISPSESLISRLPYGKISDRKDFRLFEGRDRDRIRYWNRVAEMGRRLSEDFADAVESGKIREMARPLVAAS